jgi:hypothetical protein
MTFWNGSSHPKNQHTNTQIKGDLTMSCQESYERYYEQACEYVVPVKLVVPVFVEPKVYIQPACAREKIQIALEPELFLQPEVRASQPACFPQNGYQRAALAAESME